MRRGSWLAILTLTSDQTFECLIHPRTPVNWAAVGESRSATPRATDRSKPKRFSIAARFGPTCTRLRHRPSRRREVVWPSTRRAHPPDKPRLGADELVLTRPDPVKLCPPTRRSPPRVLDDESCADQAPIDDVDGPPPDNDRSPVVDSI